MTRREQRFIRAVWEFYSHHKRSELPWRKTHDPYRILVSEVMLQQTQVERVIPAYKKFLATFKTVETLAGAPLGLVLRAWQGLGYNRRAKLLHTCAQTIVREYHGRFPKTYRELVALPGIGPYTAGAVLAFAYNTPTPFIETNIRSVFIHHFFNDATDVSDAEIFPYITRTCDTQNPRTWYWALMDYGTFIKKTYGNPNSRSKHYVPQSTFRGSDRQIRGAIIHALAERSASRRMLHRMLSFEIDRIDAQLMRLTEEGMIVLHRQSYHLPL